MAVGLVDSLATTDALSAIFSDGSLLQAMLDFEASLASVQAGLGVIPQRAADVIRLSATADAFDAEAIARDARESGTVVVPFVKALTARVSAKDSESATFVHWGATSQDVADSALMLVLKPSRAVLAADHQRLERMLRELSDRHARTVMLGRTLLQPAPPITFGLKAAGWVAPIARGWKRLDAAFESALVLELGGATGTLAALGDRGPAIADALAKRLGLGTLGVPWHTQRDRLAALVTASGIYCGSLGKMARDIALLMQDEVGEVAEPGGGSSSMPHKRNPAGCAVALAAATRTPALVAAFLSGMVQEHERAVGGWHAEWPTVAAMVQATGAALSAMTRVIGGLDVFPDRMRSNIERTRGVVFAERAMMLLAETAGKEIAQDVVEHALHASRAKGQTFREALASVPQIDSLLTPEQLGSIDSPEEYLGAAETLRLRLLSE
jgi:3-carboxy-cis,cis-muconate cycloisomerase